MGIRPRIGSIYSHTGLNLASNSIFLRPRCSKSPPPPQNGEDKKNGDKSSRDWDKAWSSFKKKGKKTLFSDFSPNKYVSWDPRPSNFPLPEEVDPIKRTERPNLMLWTKPRFTLVVAKLRMHIMLHLLAYLVMTDIIRHAFHYIGTTPLRSTKN